MPPRPAQEAQKPQPKVATPPPAQQPVVKVPETTTAVPKPQPQQAEPPERLAIKQWGNPQLIAPNALRLPMVYKDPLTGREYTTSVVIQLEPLILKK